MNGRTSDQIPAGGDKVSISAIQSTFSQILDEIGFEQKIVDKRLLLESGQ